MSGFALKPNLPYKNLKPRKFLSVRARELKSEIANKGVVSLKRAKTKKRNLIQMEKKVNYEYLVAFLSIILGLIIMWYWVN